VSYVLNKNKYVSPELTEKVNKSVEKLDYYANPVARSLRNKKTHTIGIVLQNIRNIFFPQVLAGLEEYARANDYNLQFVNTYNDIHTERRALASLKNMWVDGIILDSCVSESEKGEYLEFLKGLNMEKEIPIVMLERNLGSPDYSAVLVDNYTGGLLAARHLIETGKNKIIHITDNNNWCMTSNRMLGYLDAMREHGLEANIEIHRCDMTAFDGYNLMKGLLFHGASFDGVFAVNDQVAIGAMKAAKELGRSIPEDIAFVGFDNIFVSSMIDTPLTTVHVPKYELGKTAETLLLRTIDQKLEAPEVVTLPVKLIVRQSTDLRGDNSWELFGW